MSELGQERFIELVAPTEQELARLDRFAELLTRWTPAINLVARSTLEDLWTRHFLDSAQILDLVDRKAESLVDMGSGAGFPGMVVAILARDRVPKLRVTLVEADQRKAAFLRSVSRETSTPVRIISERVERLPELEADVVSARAVAPLEDLLELAAPHLKPSGYCLFLKGRSYREEIAAAQEKWRFTCEAVPSKIDPEAATLKIGEIRRA